MNSRQTWSLLLLPRRNVTRTVSFLHANNFVCGTAVVIQSRLLVAVYGKRHSICSCCVIQAVLSPADNTKPAATFISPRQAHASGWYQFVRICPYVPFYSYFDWHHLQPKYGINLKNNLMHIVGHPGLRSRYSGWQRAWRPKGRSSSTGSGAHPASYLMGNGHSLSGGKATGLWSWLLASN
jgi:hypothetical protein